jgi:hypothetical protein
MPIHKIEPDQQPADTPAPDNVSVSSDGQTASIPTENVQPDARPEWLPEKFDSPEAMAKSYAELEKKFSQERKPDEAEKPAEPANDGESSDNLDLKIEKAAEAEKVVEDAGFDFESLGKEYQENDGLTQETYDAMEAKGLPRNVIDAYLAGQKAIADKVVSELASVAGGPENFKAAQEWAANNLSEAELAGYNRAIDSQDYATAKLLMAGIVSQKNAAVGSDPNLVKGEGAATRSAGVTGFKSNAEMTAAINDPRYDSDPEYRALVARKIQASY